jgi:hypothetical protein
MALHLIVALFFTSDRADAFVAPGFFLPELLWGRTRDVPGPLIGLGLNILFYAFGIRIVVVAVNRAIRFLRGS